MVTYGFFLNVQYKFKPLNVQICFLASVLCCLPWTLMGIPNQLASWNKSKFCTYLVSLEVSLGCLLCTSSVSHKALHQINRQRENNGWVLFCWNGIECLQVSELYSSWRLCHYVCCFFQGTRSFLFTFSSNHLKKQPHKLLNQ